MRWNPTPCSAWLLALMLAALLARAAEPPSELLLRIEAGMHTAQINRIATDAVGRWLVTASDDKTARVWDARTGALLQVLRPPIGTDANEGKLYAVAITPDGKTVACAGWTSYAWEMPISIYLFDRMTGRMSRRLRLLNNVVLGLTFSQDGQFLAATLGGNNGLRVWRAKDGVLVAEDKDYGGSSASAAFAADGRLVTACSDGLIRLYSARFKRTAQQAELGGAGTSPRSVAWTPDGTRLAVGFTDSTRVSVLSGRDLSPVFVTTNSLVWPGSPSRVAFSSDGKTLFGGGSWGLDNSKFISLWPLGGRGEPVDLAVSQNSILDLRPTPSGGVFFGTADPSWGFLDSNGKITTLGLPPTADLRGLTTNFLVSSDGFRVRFGYEFLCGSPALFGLSERRIELNGSTNDLFAPKLEAPNLEITNWLDHRFPSLNGATIKLQPFEVSRSLAVAPDGQSFALGSGWALYLFDSAGKERWKATTPGATDAVNVTGNGKLVVAAFGDGTLRWFRHKDGQEVLSFFPHVDRKRWVLWTPDGYYDTSPGGEELIGWHMNYGKDAAADFFPASRMRALKYRPDVIARVLDTLDVHEALRLADEEAGRKHDEPELSKRLPPVVTILSPSDGTEVASTQLTLRYNVRTPSGEPVTIVRALVDGRAIETTRGMSVQGAGAAGTERSLRVTLPERDCEVALVAENRLATSVPSRVRLKWVGRPPAAAEAAIKPKLYVLAVGVSTYAKKEWQLQFADKDAREFVTAMKAQENLLYREVEVRLLTDAAATKDQVLDGFDWLEKATTAKDIGMLFLAGHGMTEPNGTYYFLPHNADPDRMKGTCVSFADVQTTLRNAAGKVLCFVDTCHSANVMARRNTGAVDVIRLVNELSSAENGVVVFASSTGRQLSQEKQEWGNGAFTKAVVEGLRGKADLASRRKITVALLDYYVSERVKELTGGQQTPVMGKPGTVPDFAIAEVK